MLLPRLIIAVTVMTFSSSAATANSTCMQIVADVSNRAGFKGATPIEAWTADLPLATVRPIAAKLENWLGKAYQNITSGSGHARGPFNYRSWYTKTADGFDYCATQTPIVIPDKGNGTIVVHCEHVKRVPKGVLPEPGAVFACTQEMRSPR